MDPKDYDEDLLNKVFVQYFAHEPRSISQNIEYIAGQRFWHTPERFTMREARDGIKYEKNGHSYDFRLKTATLEKLRNLKDGELLDMGGGQNLYNHYFIGLANQDLLQQEARLEEDLASVNKKLDDVARELLKEKSSIENQLQKIRKSVKYLQPTRIKK